MSIVIHGSMDLHWCEGCGSPVIEKGDCPSCGSRTQPVKYTPPGDIRPAFVHDLEKIVELADAQWGEGAGEALGVFRGPVMMNPCPAPDRLDEILARGAVIGSISFSSRHLRETLILRKEGGENLIRSGFEPCRGYVVCDPTAVPFILDGKNLLSPGISDCSEGITYGDEVLVMDDEGRIIGSGMARKKSSAMAGTRGMGVKVRWVTDPELGFDKRIPHRDWNDIWDHVVEVNEKPLMSKVKGAVNFIRKLVEGEDLPAVVSYSGGKDSLATLLLTRDAGYHLPIMFIDTGIEFPETVEHVHSLVDEMGLELLEERPEVGFFDNLDKFGPPGRDYRWCCKSCKLGPTTKLITERFPDGVLSFIGQRRFESDTREKKGAVWKNPWVPLQKGASPVQDWTALDIWLYIFKRKAPYNPLYARGFQRIGCWLCPSCDIAESELVDGTEVDTGPFREFLLNEMREGKYPPEWLDHGFHRFRKLPPHMRELAKELDIVEELSGAGVSRRGKDVLDLVDGFGSCIDGLSREGVLGEDVNWERTVNLLNIIGNVEGIEGTDGSEVRPPDWKMKKAAVEIYPDGMVVVRGTERNEVERIGSKLLSVLKRASGCVGCQICIGRCPVSALSLEDGMVRINEEVCTHCGACLGPCPAEAFGEDPYSDQ